MKQRLNLGLLGGSFDPVHLAHLHLARQVFNRFELDQILFIPAAQPPHKRGRRLTDAVHRTAMLSRALKPFPEFDLCTVELERGGISYTLDTVLELEDRYPSAAFFFIIGSDSLRELSGWHRARELTEKIDFLTLERPGWPVADADLSLFSPKQRKRLLEYIMTDEPLEISSSEIRRDCREGKSIEGLVDPAVEEYILKHRLYRQEEEEE
jgi:nicotinate-nucleotide adenylyltransferase